MATRKKPALVKNAEPKQRKPRKKKEDAFHLDQLDDCAKNIVRLEKSQALIDFALSTPQSGKASNVLAAIRNELATALLDQNKRFIDLAARAGVEGAEYAVEFLSERYPANVEIPEGEPNEPQPVPTEPEEVPEAPTPASA